jgi:signal transduction histidine kinase
VRTDAADLVFEVVDDGRGFDPASQGYGTGLQGIADRLGALEGSVEVISAPEMGTRIVGSLPIPEPIDLPTAAVAPGREEALL